MPSSHDPHVRTFTCASHSPSSLLYSFVQLKNRHRLSVLSKMFRWWSTVIGANEQRNYQLKLLEERVKRRQVLSTAC